MMSTPPRRRRPRRIAAAPYLFLSPFLVIFGLFLAYPLLRSIWMGFHRMIGGADATFVGLDNYRFLLRDRMFWLALANTVGFTVAFVALQIPASIALAVLLDRRRIRGRGLLRFAFFSTYLVGPVFAAVIFSGILGAPRGCINGIASRFAGHAVTLPWLTDPRLAMASVLLAALWIGIGFGVVYFAAALRGVDPAQHDAAAVDGAGPWRRFWHVTLPALRPAVAFMAMVGAVAGLQLFELPYVLFSGAGPGNAAMTLVMYLFVTGFQAGDFGYASAIGWTLVGVVALPALAIGVIARARRGGWAS